MLTDEKENINHILIHKCKKVYKIKQSMRNCKTLNNRQKFYILFNRQWETNRFKKKMNEANQRKPGERNTSIYYRLI